MPACAHGTRLLPLSPVSCLPSLQAPGPLHSPVSPVLRHQTWPLQCCVLLRFLDQHFLPPSPPATFSVSTIVLCLLVLLAHACLCHSASAHAFHLLPCSSLPGTATLIPTCTCTHMHASIHTIMLLNLKKCDYLQEPKASAGFRAGHCSFTHATQLPTASAPLLSSWQPQFMTIYSQPAPFTPRHCTSGSSLLGVTRHPQAQATCPCLACRPAPPCSAKEGEGRGSQARVPRLGWEVITRHDQRGDKPGYARKGGKMKKHYLLFTFI